MNCALPMPIYGKLIYDLFEEVCPLQRLNQMPSSRRGRFLSINAPGLLVLSIYALLLLSRLIDTAVLDRQNEYLGVVLLQIIIFLFPGLVFCKLQGNGFSGQLRLHLPRPSHILFLLVGALLLITGSVLISIQTGGIRSLSTDFSLYDTFLAKSGSRVGDIAYLVLAYAVLPAVCEEWIFRGVLPAALQKRGIVPALLFTTLSFAMLHFKFAELPIYLYAGALLFCVTYTTRSLLSAILLHVCYNLFGLFGQNALTGFYLYTGSTELFFFLLVCLFFLLAILFFGEAGRIYRSMAANGAPVDYRTPYPLEDLPRRCLYTLCTPAGIACILCFAIVCIF